MHWAIRNDNNINTVKLLLLEGKSDVNIKSNIGCDVLMIAVQHMSINNTFILLHYGYNVNINTTNNDNESALHYLIKHNNSLKSLNLQRLLLQFNIDVHIQDSDGNNALHVVMNMKRNADLHSAFLVYKSGYLTECSYRDKLRYVNTHRNTDCDSDISTDASRSGNRLISTRNKLLQTPLDIAQLNNINILISFMFDAYCFMILPEVVPILTSALIVVIIFLSAHFLGWIMNLPIIFISYLLWDKTAQSTILTKLSRMWHGFAWGIIITIIGSYFVCLMDKVSVVSFICVSMFMVCISFTLYKSSNTTPVLVKDIMHVTNSTIRYLSITCSANY